MTSTWWRVRELYCQTSYVLRGKQEGIEQTERKGYNSKFVNKLEEE
jgi:hypothetical protein